MNTHFRNLLLLPAACAFGFAASARAQITVDNSSFETPVVAQDGFTFATLSWTRDTAVGTAFIERVTGVTAADGGQYLGMENGGVVFQDLGFNYADNTTYRLRVAAGNRAGRTDAGNATTYTFTDSTAARTVSRTFDASTIAAGTFVEAPELLVDTAFYTPLVGKTIRVQLTAGGSGRSHFDNVRLDTPFLVTNTDDAGAGSLRQALANAATFSGAHTITFAPALSGQTITLVSEIVIGSNVSINAGNLPGGLTIAGGPGSNRLFTVPAGRNVSLLGLTLTGGNGTGAAGNGHGGAIYSAGGLSVALCTFTGNGTTGGGTDGGVFYNASGGTLHLTQCTLAGNSAEDRAGAILNGNGTNFSVTHCTFSDNSASFGETDIRNEGYFNVINSIITGSVYNTGTGQTNRTGANLIALLNSDSSGPGLTGTAHSTAPALLAPLGSYGGTTQTMPPLAGSPAINVAIGSTITADQRGNPVVGTPDIGAAERALTNVVSTTADAGEGSLRAAVLDAASIGGSALFFVPALSGQTITLASEIVIDSNVSIDASDLPGGLTVAGGPGSNRLFRAPAGRNVSLRKLTLTGGNGTGAVGNGHGGAIWTEGNMVVDRCTFTGNSTTGSGTDGGAIYNVSGATLRLTQCTLAGNSAVDRGGAILNEFAANLYVTHCTLANNTAFVETDIRNNGVFDVINSILTGDSYNASTGQTNRSGPNLIAILTSDSSGPGLTGQAHITAPALIGPLGSYGGPTQTLALLPTSPARNAALQIGGLTTDQRGFPLIGTPDIGAYETGTFTDYNAWIYESLPAAAPAAQRAAAFDYDGDGATNTQEWVALTNPASSTSVFRATAARSGGNMIISFSTVSGKSYTLWRSDSLTGTWTNTGLTTITGDGTVKFFTVPVPATGVRKRFHRVQVGL